MTDFSTYLSNIPDDRLVYLLAGLHCLIGLLATGVAYYKGRSLKRWLLVGLICGTPALLVALVMKRNSVTSPEIEAE